MIDKYIGILVGGKELLILPNCCEQLSKLITWQENMAKVLKKLKSQRTAKSKLQPDHQRDLVGHVSDLDLGGLSSNTFLDD